MVSLRWRGVLDGITGERKWTRLPFGFKPVEIPLGTIAQSL